MAEQPDVDLFGELVDPTPPATPPTPAPTNDMDRIETTLLIASMDGFALIGPDQRVYRRTGQDHIEAVSPDVEHAVHQLLVAGWLTIGGTHTYTHHRRSRSGRSVLVPRKTRDTATRWRSLRKPTTWTHYHDTAA